MRVTLMFAACLALGLGCTRSNLGYGGGGGSGGSGGAGGSGGTGGSGGGGTGGSGGGGGMSGGDMLGGSDDMAGGARDLAVTRMCTTDERRCFMLGGVVSQGCDASGQWRTDRRCPFGDGKMTGAMCTSGYCDPPTATTPPTNCANNGDPSEQLCEQQSAGQGQKFSCQPFITDPATMPAGVDWWCAVPATIATGVAGTKCSANGQCRTGFCGSNGTCFWGCQGATDCLLSNLQCAPVTIHVEGKAVSATSCIP